MIDRARHNQSVENVDLEKANNMCNNCRTHSTLYDTAKPCRSIEQSRNRKNMDNEN